MVSRKGQLVTSFFETNKHPLTIIDRVIDGDTFRAVRDNGCDSYTKLTIRLLGINCPETKGRTLAEGLKAKEYTEQFLRRYGGYFVTGSKKDSFGRYLFEVFGYDDEGNVFHLNKELLDHGLGVPFRA
jgi:endonuclease YncB( thermonuclease family)